MSMLGSTVERESRNSTESPEFSMAVVRESAPEGEELEAKPLDLSHKGMRLMMPQPPVFEERIQLHMRSSEPGLDFSTDAEVRWIREVEDGEGGWVIGCSFINPLQEDWVDKLATAGGIDRRQAPRRDTELQFKVRVPGVPNPAEATLLDYSPQGIRFAASEAIEPGQPLKLQFENGDEDSIEVSGTSLWQQSYESGYLVGCEFSCAQARNTFEEWVSRLPSEQVNDARDRGSFTVIGCFLIASLLALYVFLFQ